MILHTGWTNLTDILKGQLLLPFFSLSAIQAKLRISVISISLCDFPSSPSPCPIHLFSVIAFCPSVRPVTFTKELEDQRNLERQAGETAVLRCETTKPGARVIWRHGDRVLVSSSKYHLKQTGTLVELVIYKLRGADSGEISCDTGSHKTSATLTVRGRLFLGFLLVDAE
uniref:Ig-like domain-containing protein n=1 Tax=Hippocampus comes TaxID=109280 RepID=A0A3Q2YG11_HIPCM